MKTLFQFLQKRVEYGWIDQSGQKHHGINDPYSYQLQTPEELLKNRCGICWDITEVSRSFFEEMTAYVIETYYLFYDDGEGCPCHTILIFYNNNKVYWFEPMFQDLNCYYSGIHPYNNFEELKEDFIKIFLKFSWLQNTIPRNYNPQNLKLYQYQKPTKHINGFEMRNHINNSKLIKEKSRNDD